MKRLILYISVVVWAGCGAPALDEDYIIRPWLQTEEKGSLDSLYTLVGWAVEADTASWSVVSYSDAIDGKVTHRTTGEVLQSTDAGFKYDDQWALNFHFTTKPVIIVVADTDREFYAYHQALLFGGTPKTALSIVEQAYHSDTTMVQGIWRIFYGQ